MRTLFLTGVLAISFLTPLIAQVGINTDGSQPHPSAMLDVKSSFKGFLPPRMTTVQRNTIDSPADGLLIFNLTTGCIDYFLGGSWKSFCGVSEPAFQCGMKMSDSRDGKMYNTVKIGTQCWMAQNLNVGTLINGADDQADNMVIEKYCYNDLESNCCLYGGLYQWAEMVQYLNGASNSVGWNPLPAGPVQGICPEGWHLPCLADFGELISYAGGFHRRRNIKRNRKFPLGIAKFRGHQFNRVYSPASRIQEHRRKLFQHHQRCLFPLLLRIIIGLCGELVPRFFRQPRVPWLQNKERWLFGTLH